MSSRKSLFVILAILCLGLTLTPGWTPQDVKSDPLVRMPGTQPGEGVTLEGSNRCLNCHGGYNSSVEPGFNWQGSMMAQAARDFVFWACMTVAAQDSIWAIGTPNATDICQRCHFPGGWMEGRSDPTNASRMTGIDYEGLSCDFCHSMYDPFFQDTSTGQREGDDWVGAWDETNASADPSQPAAESTYAADLALSQKSKFFNGEPFFGPDNRPASPDYMENTSGQFFASSDGAKRASFADASARHQIHYSRLHKSKYMCGTCHDVSNPVLGNLGQDGTSPLTTESLSAAQYVHVERTFSEFQLSDYGRLGGSPGVGPFAPSVFATSNPGNNIDACQDCHMRDVIGAGANKQGTVVRPDGSVEHPQSGQPLHDLTGGNAWVMSVLASSIIGSPNYDAVNDQLLNQGPAVLTLDMTQGVGTDPVAMLAGAERALQQLALAATIDNLNYDSVSGALSFRVRNQTGHKLISGFPEGRRMFINIRAFAAGQLIYEANPYDTAAGTLKGLADAPSSPPLDTGESYVDALVYEVHPSSELTGEEHTFHFALATGRYKDNRIPPKGFRIQEAAERISVPVWHGVEDPDYYTAEEYAGGWDDVSMTIPAGADTVDVKLYYQTTSREYMEFLRDEINGGPRTTLSSPTPSGEPQAYVIQSDPFFAQMAAWGDTIWQLWDHNRNKPGAAPVQMASASVGGGAPCAAPIPILLSAVPGHNEISLGWSDLHTGDATVEGYRLYYDQAGKSQWRADTGTVTGWVDNGLTDGEEYCYKLTSVTAACESEFSNFLCAVPLPAVTLAAGVSAMETGVYQVTGKGGNKVTVFVLTSGFSQGDTVVIRATVFDSTGAPVPGATVDVRITGPEQLDLVSADSDSNGLAEATWNTSAPNRKGAGGTLTGDYTATVAGINAGGFVWDDVAVSVTFSIQ